MRTKTGTKYDNLSTCRTDTVTRRVGGITNQAKSQRYWKLWSALFRLTLVSARGESYPRVEAHSQHVESHVSMRKHTLSTQRILSASGSYSLYA